MRDINGIVIHHSATFEANDSDCAGLIQMATDPVHLKQRGIIDSVAEYHCVIDRRGRQHWLAGVEEIIGHCNSARNYDTVGICVGGYFHPPYDQEPTTEQVKTLIALCVHLGRLLDLDAVKGFVFGHREVGDEPTVCPGDRMPLDMVKQSVKRIMAQPPMNVCLDINSKLASLRFEDAQTRAYTRWLSKAPFMSQDLDGKLKAWIDNATRIELGLPDAKMARNPNGNYAIRTLAMYSGYDLDWQEKGGLAGAGRIILRRKDKL